MREREEKTSGTENFSLVSMLVSAQTIPQFHLVGSVLQWEDQAGCVPSPGSPGSWLALADGRYWGGDGRGEWRENSGSFFFSSSTSGSVSGSSCLSSVAPALTRLPHLPWSQILGGLHCGPSPCGQDFASAFWSPALLLCLQLQGNRLSAGTICWVASSSHLAS